MKNTNEDETINLSMRGKIILSFFVGAVLAILIIASIQSNREMRDESDVADIIEGMLYKGEHMEEIAHSQLIKLITNDETTMGDIKMWYLKYGDTSRGLLELQIKRTCYSTKWK